MVTGGTRGIGRAITERLLTEGASVAFCGRSADTVAIELTDLIRAWAQDTTAPTAFFLAHVPEAASFTEIRFYSSRALAFRPALRVTYVKRFPFGTP